MQWNEKLVKDAVSCGMISYDNNTDHMIYNSSKSIGNRRL